MIFVGGCGSLEKVENEIEFSETATESIENKYTKCVVVYDAYGRYYEKKAAENLKTFFGKSGLTVELVDQDDYAGGANKQLVCYVGDVESQPSATAWSAFDKEGFLIECQTDCLIIRGSNPENTYHAVGKLTQAHLHGNPDVVTNIKDGYVYRETFETSREAYLEDITKLPLVWEYEWETPSWALNFEEKLSALVDPNGRTMAFAHRGDIQAYPENSLEGIISAIRKGADAIEIDCELTKDGVFVLNHGSDLHATTDWITKQGKTINGVALPKSKNLYDWTYEQLQQLNLRFGEGKYSDSGDKVSTYKMATLDEAIKVANGKCFLTLDRLHVVQTPAGYGADLDVSQMGLNNPYWPTVLSLIRKHNAPQCVLYMNMGMNQADCNALRAVIEAEFGVQSPTQMDRAGWHNCVILGHFSEYDFTTDKEFKDYFDQCRNTGSFILTNRLCQLMDYIDAYDVNK